MVPYLIFNRDYILYVYVVMTHGKLLEIEVEIFVKIIIFLKPDGYFDNYSQFE